MAANHHRGRPSAPDPDLVARDFTATEPGAKLVGDITYLATDEGWVYLATVIDCYSKMVVGWAMADHYQTSLIITALDSAAGSIAIQPNCIFHSDRGSNYTSYEFATTLTARGMRQSVGRTGIRWEVSQRREFHPPLLSEPGVTVSRHRAPTVEPVGIAPCFQ